MTIYQYVFFDRETCEFSHMESTDLDDLNRRAYQEWLSVIEFYRDEDMRINCLPFKSYEEFCEDTRHYLDLDDIAGMEGERFTITV